MRQLRGGKSRDRLCAADWQCVANPPQKGNSWLATKRHKKGESCGFATICRQVGNRLANPNEVFANPAPFGAGWNLGIYPVPFGTGCKSVWRLWQVTAGLPAVTVKPPDFLLFVHFRAFLWLS
jgi:hypothetical protein